MIWFHWSVSLKANLQERHSAGFVPSLGAFRLQHAVCGVSPYCEISEHLEAEWLFSDPVYVLLLLQCALLCFLTSSRCVDSAKQQHLRLNIKKKAQHHLWTVAAAASAAAEEAQTRSFTCGCTRTLLFATRRVLMGVCWNPTMMLWSQSADWVCASMAFTLTCHRWCPVP